MPHSHGESPTEETSYGTAGSNRRGKNPVMVVCVYSCGIMTKYEEDDRKSVEFIDKNKFQAELSDTSKKLENGHT